MTEPTDPAITFVRDLIARKWWSVVYHECQLPKAYAKLRLVRELLTRAGFDEDRLPAMNDDEDESDEMTDLAQMVAAILSDRRGTVAHHEQELRKAHAELALCKIMLARGNYTEIDLDALEADARTEYAQTYRPGSSSPLESDICLPWELT